MSVRCQRANAAGADLYYSAHHNAGINGGRGGGVVAFSLGEGSTAAGWRDALYAAIVAAGGLAGNRSSPKTTADFYVLRNTAMPAVLIEHGFMDAPDDVPAILREDYAKAVGYAVAECIATRAGLAKKAQAAAPTIAPGLSQGDVKAMIQSAIAEDRKSRTFATLDKVQDWARPTVAKLLDKGVLQGDGQGLNLGYDLLRTLVILDRLGKLD
nr:MAG TPA: Cell wall hydrolase autolysin [Caudoviricetes sp.]